MGALSAGLRARLALALALGKAPDLLLLDEPMAELDPLARHEIAGVIMSDAAERGTTVVISSHVLAELEPLCDHLLMIDEGRLRLAGPTDELVASHDVITAPVAEDGAGDGYGDGDGDSSGGAALSAWLEGLHHTVVGARAAGRALTALIRPGSDLPEDWITATPTLEDVVLGYMRNPSAPPLLIAPQEDAVAVGPDRKVSAL